MREKESLCAKRLSYKYYQHTSIHIYVGTLRLFSLTRETPVHAHFSAEFVSLFEHLYALWAAFVCH